MPLLEVGFPANKEVGPQIALVKFGPTINVDVGFDLTQHDDHPETLPALALVDTGATECCIDTSLADRLGLPVVDRIIISGAGGPHETNMYLARIVTSDLGGHIYGRFAGVLLADGGQHHEVLLGRTFLQNLIMIYDGVRGQVTLAK